MLIEVKSISNLIRIGVPRLFRIQILVVWMMMSVWLTLMILGIILWLLLLLTRLTETSISRSIVTSASANRILVVFDTSKNRAAENCDDENDEKS
jgi:cytochrome b subunit of formate dehydrogenase